MACNNICGNAIAIIKMPDGGIARGQGLPSDPQHNKGDFEIIKDIIKKGIENTNWHLFEISTGTDSSALSLKYEEE